MEKSLVSFINLKYIDKNDNQVEEFIDINVQDLEPIRDNQYQPWQIFDWHPSQFQITTWLVHEQFMFYAWGVAVDIAIIISRNFKAWKWYMMLHGILFLIVDLGTLALIVLTMFANTYPLSYMVKGITGQHFIGGCLLGVFIIVNHITGLIIQFKYIDPVTGIRDKYSKVHKFHIYLGNVSYLLGKYVCLSGEMLINERNNGIILICSSMAFRLIMELLQYKKPKFYINMLICNPIKNYFKKENIMLVQMIKDGVKKQEIFKTFPNKKYCIYGNKVCDLNNLTHPGGNYLTEKCVGREVDCYLYGGYGLESSKRKAWNHSQIAYVYLKNNEIGSIYQEQHDPIFLDYRKSYNNKQQNISISELSTVDGQSDKGGQSENLLINNVKDKGKSIKEFSNNTCFAEENERIYDAELLFKKELTNDSGIFEFSLGLGEYEFKINNDMQGVEWMGRYFSLKVKGSKKKRCYTTVLSQTQRNQKLRSELISIYYGQFENKIKDKDFYQSNKFSSTLPMLVKDYNLDGALSTRLFQQEAFKEKYEIVGPYGLGLQINEESMGNYLIICGGTGLFPFLDLLDFLLKKCLYMAALQEKGKEYAEQNFNFQGIGIKDNLDDFKLSLYGSFGSSDNFVGKDILLCLMDLQKKYEFDFINICVRFSDKKNLENLRCVQDRFDERFWNQEFNDKETGYDLCNIQQAWICGPPSMVKSITEILPYYMNENNIHYL